MITSDKLISFGANAAASTFCYYAIKSDLPTKALRCILGGVAASTLFQAFYPDFAVQMREKCGESFTRAVTWLYPLMIPLGGYLGGTPMEVNFFVIMVFFPIRLVAGSLAWLIADDRRSAAAKPIQEKVNKAIQDGSLQTAAEKIQEVETILQSRTDNGKGAWSESFQLEDSKGNLSKALLNLSSPNTAEAEKWALAISNGWLKLSALKTLIQHLLKTDGKEKKVLELFEKCRLLAKNSRNLLTLQLEIAIRYGKTELIDDLKQKVSELQGSLLDLCTLFSLTEKGIALGKFEVPKHALNRVVELIGNFVLDDVFWTDSFWHLESCSRKLFHCIKPTHFTTPESCLLYYLVVFAAAMGDYAQAEELLKHENIAGEARVAAHLELSHALGHVGEKEKMRQHLKEAEALINSHAFPEGVADRESRQAAFAQRWNEALFEIQLRHDLSGAVEMVKKFSHNKSEKYLSILEKTDFENLIKGKCFGLLDLIKIEDLEKEQQLRFLKLLSSIDLEKLFEVCEPLDKKPTVHPDPSDTFVVKDEMDRAKIILILGKARLKRQEYNQADVLIEVVRDYISFLEKQPTETEKNKAIELRKKLRSLTSWPRVRAQRNWFSWAS